MSKKTISAAALAKKSRRNTGGPRCLACNDPKIRKFILDYLSACEATEGASPDISGQLLPHLREYLGYSYGEAALRRHLRNCERETWSTIRQHG